jgi:hypothetical protein
LSSWRKEKYSQLKIRPILLLVFFSLFLSIGAWTLFHRPERNSYFFIEKAKQMNLEMPKILDFSVKLKMSARGNVTR